MNLKIEIEKIRSLIAKAETGKIWPYFNDSALPEKFQKRLDTLKNTKSQLNKHNMLGLVSYPEFLREDAKITLELLTLLDEIKQLQIEESDINTNIANKNS